MLLGVILVLGGGPTRPSLAFAVQFCLGAGLLAYVVSRDGGAAFGRAPIAVRVLIVVLLAFPVFQLLPLPPAWWDAAPGRDLAAAIRRLAGAGDRWLPLSLVPQVTAQVVFSMVVLLALFLATLSIDARGARLLVGTVLMVQALSVIVGVFQLTSGGLALDFYDSAHRLNLLGFFANRNHTAVFLAAAIPLAVGLAASEAAGPRALLMTAGLTGAAVLVAVLGTVSRAGVMLTMAAFLLSLLLLVSLPAARGRLIAIGAAAGVIPGGLLLISPTVAAVFDRYADVGEDQRWTFYTRTWALIPDFLPWGSGLGSFVPVYAANERLADVKLTFVNNAHSDFLEILLEGGVPGGLLAVGLIAVVLWCGWRVFRLPRSEERAIGLAGLIVAMLFLFHSAVDYPLRRMACAALFAVAIALLVRPLMRAPAPPANAA